MAVRGGSALVAGLLVVLALAGGLLLGQGMGSAYERIDDPVDVGFAQDMKVHHAQAVQMSAIVHRRSPDPALNFLALDILTTQQGQIGIMTGWLDLWQHTQTSIAPVMAWMGDAHSGPMPGMATREQIAQLETLPVPQMEELYLRLMIRHHAGALPMAAYAAQHGESRDLVRLAQGMEAGQASEIELMQSLLAARGLRPEPTEGIAHGDSGPAPAASHEGHAPGPAASQGGHG